MRCDLSRWGLWILAGLCLGGLAVPAAAQQGGGGPGGGGGGQLPGGILIRADGLIDGAAASIPAAGLRQRRQQAEKLLPEALRTPSVHRSVSLRRLDVELSRLLADSEPLPADIRFLAGLTRIDEIVFDESGDVVISGPAEGFAPASGGRVMGLETGRPVLCLEDLLTALRAPEILERCGCSIDPDSARLAESQAWLRANATPATLQVAQARMEHMIRLMGRWNVTTFGVPEDSRMSLSMVEADYLMKRLAIGVERSGVGGLKSTLQLAKPGDNMMRRWWFTAAPGYLSSSADRSLWLLSGPRFQLLAQEEIMASDGTLIDADDLRGSSEEFARLFNERREELVRRHAAFADLQNLFDVLVVAGLLRGAIEGGQLSWTPQVLTSEGLLSTAGYVVPRQTLPLLNTRQSPGGPLIGAFSGGVVLRIQKLLSEAATAVREPQRSGGEFADGEWWTE
ncbi:MAG: hypothetical protein RLZZ436_1958 [Planctomycetota bacterium]|jgi:hypothetical protein